MNVFHAAASKSVSHEHKSDAGARLSGRLLMLARGAWVSLVLLTLATLVILLPSYFAQLQTVCSGPRCALVQPTSESLRALKQLGLSPSSYAIFMLALTLVTALVCFLVGTVIFWRKSEDWMALLVSLTVVILSTLFVTYALLESQSSWQVLAIVANVFGHGVLFLFAALFPNGKLVPRWSGWIAVGWILWCLLYYTVLHHLPFAYHSLALIIGLACAALAQIYRYRYVASPTQRQQLKWVILAGCLAAITVIVLDVPNLILPLTSQTALVYRLFVSSPVALLATLLIALSFGLAILRYRLYDVDIIINRTLVYGSLTLTLALIYFSLVIGLQALLRGIISQDNSVAIVVSTLTIAALFQPLRLRLQRIIDRRFYRRKYDATKIVEAFSTTLRSEVDLSQVREHLLTAVQETMQPTHASLWVRWSSHQSKPDTDI